MRLYQFSPSATDPSPTDSAAISDGHDEGAQILADIQAMAARLNRFLDDAFGDAETLCRRPQRQAKADER
jgi:hypothetical protein